MLSFDEAMKKVEEGSWVLVSTANDLGIIQMASMGAKRDPRTAWQKIFERCTEIFEENAKNETAVDILVDIKDSNMSDAALKNNRYLVELICNPHIYMCFRKEVEDGRDIEGIANKLSLLANMFGNAEFDKSRMVEFYAVPKVDKKKSNKEYNYLISGVVENEDGSVSFKVFDKLNSISGPMYVEPLGEILELLYKKSMDGVKVVVDFQECVISESNSKSVYDMLKKYAKAKNMTILIDEEFANICNFYRSTDTKQMNLKELLSKNVNIFRDMEVGTVGILEKYVISGRSDKVKAKDLNNRELSFSRIAIYRGIVNDCAVFDTYNFADFKNPIDDIIINGANEDDYNDYFEPINVANKIYVKLDQIGIYNKTFGRAYQFKKPIQLKESSFSQETYVNDAKTGEYELKRVSLPQYIEIVLQSIEGMEYNGKDLNECIEKSVKFN